ncbi:hypothetical protein cypCar_00043926, partial [Cyprinus carpio]
LFFVLCLCAVEMLTGWWKVTDIEELRSIEKACHSRGIREKQLQKQLQKHMGYVGQVCSRSRDVSVIHVSELEENQVSEDTVQSWCVEEQAMDMDIGVLQQVEELEQKVSSASLQVKVGNLDFYEHFAHRLAEEDLAPGLKQWRKALGEVRSASQLSLCMQQLHKSIAWEKSIMKVASSQSLKTKQPLNRSSGGLKKPAEAKRHMKASVAGDSEDDSGRANSTPRKVLKEIKKRKTEENPSTNPAKQESPRTARDDSKDLAIILLAELESHQDAGPFLTPVNPKSVPGYRKIIKKPMDFSTIRDKLTNSQYLNLETFIIDVNLVFDNCEKFNEDNSVIGRAGHTMRRFFQRRWTELLRQNSLKAGLGT